MAQKKIQFEQHDILMKPACHPSNIWKVLYRPMRGGDQIIIKCDECYREYFKIKLPKEGAE